MPLQLPKEVVAVFNERAADRIEAGGGSCRRRCRRWSGTISDVHAGGSIKQHVNQRRTKLGSGYRKDRFCQRQHEQRQQQATADTKQHTYGPCAGGLPFQVKSNASGAGQRQSENCPENVSRSLSPVCRKCNCGVIDRGEVFEPQKPGKRIPHRCHYDRGRSVGCTLTVLEYLVDDSGFALVGEGLFLAVVMEHELFMVDAK